MTWNFVSNSVGTENVLMLEHCTQHVAIGTLTKQNKDPPRRI